MARRIPIVEGQQSLFPEDHYTSKTSAPKNRHSEDIPEAKDALIKTIRELSKIAFSRIGEIVDEDGRAIPFKSWTESAKASVKSIKTREVTTKLGTTVTSEIVMHDKLKSLEMLARITGALNSFDQAVATLATYGVNLKEGDDGGYFVEED